MWPVRQLAPIDQTSNICAKLIKTQVGCVTNVDSYSLYACTYVASVRDISTIVCYDQVLFIAVTKLLRFLEKTTNIFAASGFHKIPRIIYCACALTVQLYVTGELPVYTMCSQFKHYVGLVNLPHSSSCPMFPYHITASLFVMEMKTESESEM